MSSTQADLTSLPVLLPGPWPSTLLSQVPGFPVRDSALSVEVANVSPNSHRIPSWYLLGLCHVSFPVPLSSMG